jgi:hypothetical protein
VPDSAGIAAYNLLGEALTEWKATLGLPCLDDYSEFADR